MAEVVPIRGVIKYRGRARQIIDFRGLTYGNITPTDIDGLIEYKDKCILLIEIKHQSKPGLDFGQRVAFERVCTGMNKPTLLLHAVHNEPVQNDIDAADCVVHRYFWKKKWLIPRSIVTVKEAADKFFTRYDV